MFDFMDFLDKFLVIVTLCLLVNFGKNYLNCREQSYDLGLLITHKLTDKQKWSTIVSRDTCEHLLETIQIDGLLLYHG